MKQDWLTEKEFGLRRLQRLDFIQAETVILFLIQEDKKWDYLQGAHVLALSSSLFKALRRKFPFRNSRCHFYNEKRLTCYWECFY